MCSGLNSVTIENGVTSIGNEVFGLCTSLTSITLPSSITSIGDWAFAGCSGLTSIIVENTTPPTVYSDTFYDVNVTACILKVPVSAISVYEETDIWKKFTNIEAYNHTTNLSSRSFQLHVSPNPAKDIVYFSEKVNKVSVYSLQGNLVYQTVINSNEMNISHLHNGMYMLRIYVTEKDVVDIKLIKQ